LVSVLLGKGDGTFAPHVDYATDEIPNSAAIGDFNGDGMPDLVWPITSTPSACSSGGVTARLLTSWITGRMSTQGQ